MNVHQSYRHFPADGYILNQIESRLEGLDMKISRKGENELFLIKMDIVRTYRKKDMLRNLKVVVQTDDSTIQIILKTETIFVFLLGLLPLIAIFIGDNHFTARFLITSSIFYWSIGFLTKYFILRNVKNDIENHLRRINNLY